MRVARSGFGMANLKCRFAWLCLLNHDARGTRVELCCLLLGLSLLFHLSLAVHVLYSARRTFLSPILGCREMFCLFKVGRVCFDWGWG